MGLETGWNCFISLADDGYVRSRIANASIPRAAGKSVCVRLCSCVAFARSLCLICDVACHARRVAKCTTTTAHGCRVVLQPSALILRFDAQTATVGATLKSCFHTRAHTRTHAHTRAHTHAHAHTRTHLDGISDCCVKDGPKKAKVPPLLPYCFEVLEGVVCVCSVLCLVVLAPNPDTKRGDV